MKGEGEDVAITVALARGMLALVYVPEGGGGPVQVRFDVATSARLVDADGAYIGRAVSGLSAETAGECFLEPALVSIRQTVRERAAIAAARDRRGPR
jgi:hypothetical protein